ncbi:myrosinase 1-like [Anoplophora glabripennis]|uniref:myrosinase 1-like n=1 Tax=Anoplophora glabripennis TaxID=217634 RepID=UPI000C777CD3|nr:myrosinase 1-like [Anoplophora glabripennis]
MKVLVLVFSLFYVGLADDEINSRYFPKNFKFGVANAAPQIEGGWNEDGKTESIWDHFVHTHPEKIVDRSTLDIACDSYHKYKEDVAMVKAMGLDYYRLSIAWARILPTGYPDKVNQAGVRYYKNLFAELKAVNVEPMVTLYHWDLPQTLEDQLGGWLNETVADLFAEYARLCFELFKDDVKMWITINEPKQVCQAGYGTGYLAPGVVSNGVGEYICARNVILAHAKAYHIYDDEFRATNQGRIAMVIDTSWSEPGSDSEEDQEAAERMLQFTVRHLLYCREREQSYFLGCSRK